MNDQASPFLIRRWAQNVLGAETVAYLLHLRPMEWPIMTAHFLLGSLLAAGWKSVSLHGGATLLGWFIFVALLNGGTLAINSAYDQDEGDIGYLKAPPKPPKHLALVSGGMLLLALGLGFLLPPVFAWSNATCVVMSVLYSVPPIRLKARAGWDLLINCVGFGSLTPLAGWGATGRPLTAAFFWLVLGFCLLFGALYPLTQIYQVTEDRARGDRTLVIRFGVLQSLILALVLTVLAHGAFALALPRPSTILAWGGLGISAAAWLGVLVPWLMRWDDLTDDQAKSGMYWALGAWAVTDVSLLLACWPG